LRDDQRNNQKHHANWGQGRAPVEAVAPRAERNTGDEETHLTGQLPRDLHHRPALLRQQMSPCFGGDVDGSDDDPAARARNPEDEC